MAYERKNNAATGFTGVPVNETPMTGFGSNRKNDFDQAAEAAKSKLEAEQSRSMLSIFNQNTSGPLSRQTGTVRLIDLYERAAKVLKAVEGSSLIVNAVKLDHQSYNVFLPSVVIVGRDRAHPDVAWAYALLIEREDSIEPETRTQQGGYKTVIPVVSGTAWDSRYVEAVKAAVSTTLSLEASNINVFSACVVPKDLDLGPNDIASTNVNANLQNLMYNAVYAINTRVEEHKGLSGFALSATGQNEVMTVEPRFSRNLVRDLAGREKRADIDLKFSLKQHNNKSSSLNGSESTSRKFGEMAGYIDFIPVLSEGQVASGWGTSAQVITKFSPLFVITSMFTEQAGSLHAQLAMLMSAATMANGDEWVNSMYERHLASKRAGESLDIGEIGALNIEVNLPQYRPQDAQGINTSFGPIVDTRIADYDRNKYINLIQQLCRQDMFIAIDAPNVGAESWYTDIFRASAGQSEIATVKADRIFQAAQELTNDRFAAAFHSVTKNTNLWLTEPTMIHNGYYVKHGTDERRDIRDVDTLTIANILGPNDPTACARWGATFQPGVDQERALTERKEMIEQVCGGSNNVVYTGYSTRLFLNPAVVKALLMCAAAVKFNMRFVSAYNTGIGGFGNAGFNFGGASGLSSGNVSSTFNGGFNGGQQGNVMGTNSFFGSDGLKM